MAGTREADQLSAALAFVAEAVERVHHGERGTPGIAGAPLLVATKVYGEASLLLRATQGLDVPRSGVARARHHLRETLATALVDAGGLWQAMLAPGRRWDHLFPLLLTPGPWSGPARELARTSATYAGGTVSEELERHWLLAVAGGSRVAPDGVARSLRRSHLHAGLDLLHGDLTQAYAFTHAILHGTDQGRWASPLATSSATIAGRARSLMAGALIADNDDIAAELLWTWPLLDLSLEPAAAWVAESLGQRFEQHGFLPGPTYCPTQEATLDKSGRPTYRRQTSYHTTLVWGLTCAGHLRRGRRDPSPAVPGPDPLPLLEGLPGRWSTAAATAPRAERCGLARLVLAGSLRHAAVNGDLPRVHRLVTWAVDAGLESEPTVVQAARWLREISELARLGELLSGGDQTVGGIPAAAGMSSRT